jgi:membrane-bound lytic murein transglycosylase D
MPATGRMFNMTVNDTIDDRMDPIIAAEGAARYLSQAHRRLGSWPLAITSYNHGQGGMANAKAQHGNDIGKIVKQYQGPYFGFASRNFYAEFIAAREVSRNANRYFPEGVRAEEPWPHDRLVLRHSMPVDHLANHFGLTPYRLADLNKHWSDRAREGRAQLPAGSTVWLPAGTTRRVASQPPPVSRVMIAQAEPKATPVTRQAVAKSTQPASRAQTATKTTSKTQTKQTLAKADSPKEKAQAKSKAAQTTKAKTTLAKVDPPKQRATPKAKPAEKTLAKAAAKPRYHVVKPQETLYRVATQNGITVSELRRLNQLKPHENHIWVGQKLKVGS